MTNLALIITKKMHFKCATLTSAATPPKFFCENYLISILWCVDTERHSLFCGRRDENGSFPINAHYNRWVGASCPPIFIKYRLTTSSDRDLVAYAFVSNPAFCCFLHNLRSHDENIDVSITHTKLYYVVGPRKRVLMEANLKTYFISSLFFL